MSQSTEATSQRSYAPPSSQPQKAAPQAKQSMSDWLFDKAWGKVENKVEKEGWFDGITDKIRLVFWLIVAGLGSFVALCVVGLFSRMVSTVFGILGGESRK